MNNKISLPKDYIPFSRLQICSNNLISIPTPFAIYDNPVLLIGYGKTPLIWLSAPIAPNSKQWRFIVEANKSLNPVVYVHVNEEQNSVLVRIGDITIINAITESEGSAKVELLDLRPIGLNIYGSSSELKIGTNTISNSAFSGGSVAFALA
jgi:hypothetical protein